MICKLLLVHDEVSRDTILLRNFYSKFKSNGMSVALIKNEDSVFTSLYFSFNFSSNYFPCVLLKY